MNFLWGPECVDREVFGNDSTDLGSSRLLFERVLDTFFEETDHDLTDLSRALKVHVVTRVRQAE